MSKIKEKIEYICENCGYKTLKWLGRCPSCESWNSFQEDIKINIKKLNNREINTGNLKIYNLHELESTENIRINTTIKEFDRVLGGGLVLGEIVLLTGHPGVGKSTLLLQAADEYSKDNIVYYVAGEESASQIKLRSERLNINSKNLFILQETEINIIENQIRKNKPKIVIIDSIQTVYNSEYDSIPGTITQIRESTLKIIDIAKKENISFFIVGHITKDGKIAGPKLLEHMVDAVLTFEGEENYYYRILRSVKNRFGSTNEIGIFNMNEKGMTEVLNPSEFFLNDRDDKNVGSIIMPTLEGSKIFLVEVQALCTTLLFGLPRRVVQGFDFNRIQIISAILEKILHIELGGLDLYLNVPGGMYVKETAADLAIAISILSSVKNIEISNKIAAIGELGLRGEIRKVSFIDKRLIELEKLGFKGVYLPEGNRNEIDEKKFKIKVIYLRNLNELLERMNKNG
ncbi:MAG: DNA repair protein RadA [Fusobacteria bacterium]|nr:DNA repair protein RadA [Fusobacteriota bacterium]